MKNRFRLLLGFAAMLLLATGAAYALQNADVAGDWVMTITTPRGERTINLHIEQEGTTLTGTSQAEGQDEPSALTGTVDGNNVTLNIQGGGRGGRGGGGGGMPWEGTVDGDTMSGERTMPARGGGDSITLQWTAVRQ
jgi:hypothetical protein